MKPIIAKNILLHILLLIFFFITAKEVGVLPVEKLDTLLLFVGLIVIAPITSNFIYTYKHAGNRRAVNMGHITTFLSMLVVGILFIILDILLVKMLGNILVFHAAIVLFWIAVVSFDFADYANRNVNKC